MKGILSWLLAAVLLISGVVVAPGPALGGPINHPARILTINNAVNIFSCKDMMKECPYPVDQLTKGEIYYILLQEGNMVKIEYFSDTCGCWATGWIAYAFDLTLLGKHVSSYGGSTRVTDPQGRQWKFQYVVLDSATPVFDRNGIILTMLNRGDKVGHLVPLQSTYETWVSGAMWHGRVDIEAYMQNGVMKYFDNGSSYGWFFFGSSGNPSGYTTNWDGTLN